MAAMTEIQQLHLRWHKKTGEDMPLNIASLPIDRIRRAVELTEKGITVAVPSGAVPMTADVQESSLEYWDNHDNKLGS
jgi:hypothetical protein